MSDPNNTTADANQLINTALEHIESGNTDAANSALEKAAQIYEQNGADGDAQDARDLIQE